MMNIVWLSTGLFKERYGQQNYESCVLDAIYRNWEENCGFIVLLLNDKYVPEGCNSRPKLSFFCFGGYNRFVSKVRFILYYLWFIFKYRPKLVICGHVNLSFLCFISRRIFKIKYITLVYGKDIWNINSILKIRALGASLAIIAMSEHTASKVKKQIPLMKGRIFIIPAYVDTQLFFPQPKPQNLAQRYSLKDCKVILTVSRLSSVECKGYDKVIRILPEIIKVVPKIKYLIVGGGDDIPNVIKLINDSGLKDHVVLAGPVAHEDLNSYYNSCDLFIMPSKQEGFGIVFLEALACGKPVIAGSQDGSRYALLEGRLGFLIEPDDSTKIAELAIKILKGDIKSNLVDEGFLRPVVIENFSIERFDIRIREVINYINEGPGRSLSDEGSLDDTLRCA